MKLSYPSTGPVNARIELPISKSECNRALMLSAWSGGRLSVSSISDARDSRLLATLLSMPDATEYNAKDAGTTFRFLATFLAMSNRVCRLTGTERMKERPVGGLVKALRELGCKIEYLEKEGFPPLEFQGFSYSGKKCISVDPGESSQFISSLMMAAPSLPEGLEIALSGKAGSFPYIELTAGMMQQSGLEAQLSRQEIRIPQQVWKEGRIEAGADWSSASYWYAVLACLPEGSSFEFSGLKSDSLQGDKVLKDLGIFWDISTSEIPDGIRIVKSGSGKMAGDFVFDFEDCPDLALTFIVLCAASGRSAKFNGLSSLKIKESNRLRAIQEELKKVGVELQLSQDEKSAFLESPVLVLPDSPIEFNTHQDHRIAMSLAILPLAAPFEAIFHDSEVSEKSYPAFWKELTKAGFRISA